MMHCLKGSASVIFITYFNFHFRFPFTFSNVDFGSVHAIISLQKWLGSIAWLPSRILRVGCAPRALNTALGALAAAQRWQLAAQLFANEKVPQQGAFHALLSHLATLTHWLPTFSLRFFFSPFVSLESWSLV
jgi:hypothetical protein